MIFKNEIFSILLSAKLLSKRSGIESDISKNNVCYLGLLERINALNLILYINELLFIELVDSVDMLNNTKMVSI